MHSICHFAPFLRRMSVCILAIACMSLLIVRSSVLLAQERPSDALVVESHHGEGDLLIADFEGDTYGEWKAAGEAFGSRPVIANVTMRNKVVGHCGVGLVNTFLGGDKAIGTLTSPPLTIDREHINFLIGAGDHRDRTCMNLLVDGKVVRSEVGPAVKDKQNREVLCWRSWDVASLKGKQAVLQIVDNYSGGWGHINVDQIVQSNTPRRTDIKPADQLRLPGAPSLLPQYTFADTLEAQEKQLEANPLLNRFHASRKAMADDRHRPFYHYVNPEGRLNDPNGLCYWQGRWHLFYQAYPPEDPRQHWGHAVSDDLIHWRDLPLAIYPDPEDKCFSGTCYVDGEDRVIAAYHGIGTGTMVAVSSDPLLLNWKKVTGNAVIPFPKPEDPPLPYNIFDPCIWKQGEYYYIILAGQTKTGPAGKAVRALSLHRSKDLAKWEYLHQFLEGDHFSLVGDDGACPYFWPIGTPEQKKHILLHFSHMSGGKYMLGDYDTERDKFVVTDGGDFNHGPMKPCGTHAPSAYPDPKNPGAVIAIFNMNPGMATQGWNQIMSLPRRLTLSEDGLLETEPAGDIESLRKDHRRVQQQLLPRGQEIVLEDIKGNAMELIAEVQQNRAGIIELNVLRSPNKEEYTSIQIYPMSGFSVKHGLRKQPQKALNHGTMTIDTSRSSTLAGVQARPPEVAQYRRKGKTVKLHVFVDKSIVEVFVDGTQCASVRVYPGREDSVGVSLRAVGSDALLKSLDAWQMENIYQ